MSESPTIVPAAPGHEAIYRRQGGIHRNAVVAWVIHPPRDSGDGFSGSPITLAYPGDGEKHLDCAAIVFPDGHVEDYFGRRRWNSMADFLASTKATTRAS